MSRRRSDKVKDNSTSLVYSTDGGRICPGCRRAQIDCTCQTNLARTDRRDADGIVRLHRERSGRKGKGVTLIKGLTIPDAEITALAKTLKSSCGVGGAVKSGVIELQTAEREKIKALLDTAGFTVKIAGG